MNLCKCGQPLVSDMEIKLGICVRCMGWRDSSSAMDNNFRHNQVGFE